MNAFGSNSGPFRVRFGDFSDVRFPCLACPFSVLACPFFAGGTPAPKSLELLELLGPSGHFSSLFRRLGLPDALVWLPLKAYSPRPWLLEPWLALLAINSSSSSCIVVVRLQIKVRAELALMTCKIPFEQLDVSYI